MAFFRFSAPMITVLATLTLLPACSTVSVNKQTSAKTINSQRSNIITSHNLSSQTASTLLSAGLNEQACMQQFDLCLAQLSDSMLNAHYRSALAIFAELHYAKARQLAKSRHCQHALTRPPLDPYYINAPVSETQAKKQQQDTETCLLNYKEHLFDAIKFSYSYLFYDSLTHDFEGAEQPKNSANTQNRIPNEMDIQTQDIYNAASNDVITQLYESTDDQRKMMGAAQIQYLPIEAMVDDSTEATISNHHPIQGRAIDQVNVMSMQIDQYKLSIYLPNENNYLKNASKQTSALANLVSTYAMRLSGLNSVSKRPGLGITLVASLDDRYTTTIRQLLISSVSGRLNKETVNGDMEDSEASTRIYPTGHLLLTGLIKPVGDSVLDVLATTQLDIHLYNPYRSDSVHILGNDYPLAANFSAGYGMWLSENQLDGVGYLNLLTRRQETSLPKLFMLEPYNPNKRVIIMLHGLASSPATWVNLTNDIFNDDKLRGNYQVWQIFYPTNLPILENRYQIQHLLQATYEQTDPSGKNKASNNSVIISHSMGGVIARMMLSDDNLTDHLEGLIDQKLLPDSTKRQIDSSLKTAFGKQEVAKRFKLQTLPQVDTVVFLSTPFQGTDYANRWFTRALRRVIYLPINLVKTVTDNLATIATQGDLAQHPLGALYLENGASQLSNKSSFIKLTRDIAINERITYHSIIANNDSDIAKGLAQMQPEGAKIDLSKAGTQDEETTDNSFNSKEALPNEPLIAAVMVNEDISQALTERLSDGIVPYSSSHLDGAASESIISGGHSIQTNPQTILTLRRILHQQLQH